MTDHPRTLRQETVTTPLPERYSESLARSNEPLTRVDWARPAGWAAVGIFAGGIIAQALSKVVLDTINLLPVGAGLLEPARLGGGRPVELAPQIGPPARNFSP